MRLCSGIISHSAFAAKNETSGIAMRTLKAQEMSSARVSHQISPTDFQMTESGPPPRPLKALPACIFLLGFIYLLLGIFQPLNPFDEGFINYGAERVSYGDVPYRDFWVGYTPGQFYTVAGVFRIFGYSILVERIWDTVVRFGICVLVLLITQKLAGKKYAYMSFLICVVYLAWCGSYGYPVIPAMFCGLGAILLLIEFYVERRSFLLFLGGLATGTTVLYRQDIGVYILLSAVAAMVIVSFERPMLKGQIMARGTNCFGCVVSYGLGICVLLIPCFFYFLRAVPIGVLRADLITFPREASRFLPLPPILPGVVLFKSSLRLNGIWFLFYAPIAIFLVGWVGLIRSVFNPAKYPEKVQQFGRAALTVFGTGSLLTVITRADIIHCLAITIAASALLPVLLADLFARRRPAWSKALVMLCLALLSLPYVAAPIRKLYWYDSRYGPRKGEPVLQRARFFQVPADEENAIRFIQQHVPEEQALFVGNSQHHRVFVNNIMFYFLSQRRAGTMYYEFEPGMTTTVQIQSDIVADLSRNQVKYVVRCAGFDRSDNPGENLHDSGVTIIDDFLAQKYRPVEKFGDYSIWASQ